MPKKKSKTGNPQVHKDLEGLEVEINEFGEIKTNMSVDRLNEFLNKNVDDKKLRDRDDLNLPGREKKTEEGEEDVLSDEPTNLSEEEEKLLKEEE